MSDKCPLYPRKQTGTRTVAVSAGIGNSCTFISELPAGDSGSAMNPDSRLLIIEMVLPTGDAPHLGKVLDIIMLAIPGGQERTEPEYRALLDKAGFHVKRVVPTGSAVSVVEAALV